MSRKRTLKKQQKRQESALAQLEELYRRGADDEFLARVAGQVKDLADSPLAACWEEAAGRALRQSLARADLGCLERLLGSLRRAGPLRPEAVLAEAVLDIAAGRLEAARSRLAGLAGTEGAVFPRGLLPGLRSLAQDTPAPDAPEAAGELVRALQALETRGFAPTEADRQALARSVEAVRSAAPEDAGELRRLLDGASRCLSLLADLAALADKLAGLPEEDRTQASQVAAGWLRGPGPLLAALLSTAAAPPLLAPLRHAVRLRWRAVLEQVAAREGPPGLAALCALDPKLFAIDVSLPGGLQAGLASLRQGAQARELLAARRFRELAHLLRSRGETEADRGTLAVLWSLELWASIRRAPLGEARGNDWLEDIREPPAYRTLVRLQQMAGEIGRRFPREQRGEVARALRDKLFDLCEKAFFDKLTAEAALSLLEHQPGDPGLLIVGVAGAVAGEDARTLRSVEAWLARAAKPQAGDPSTVRRLLAQAALEVPQDVARILELLRPLFADGVWPEIAAFVAREMAVSFTDALTQAVFETLEQPRPGNRPFDEVRRNLDRLRPSLAGTSSFAAMELALDCWSLDRSAVGKRLKKFLAGVPDLEGPLTAFLILQKVTAESLVKAKEAETARRTLAHAVIDRLDDRWQLWGPAVEPLAFATRGGHLQRLEEKIRQLLASPQAEGSRREIEKAFALVQRLGRPGGRGRPKKPSRRLSIPQFG